jgi:beta-mannosidase
VLTDLGGRWSAREADDELRRSFPRPDLDDATWVPVTVPGHWQAEPAFATSDGPLLFRRRFEAASPAPGQRVWLVMEGVFYQSDVWLDGSYLGDTEGYFFPHEFDVTAPLSSRPDHLLAVEVGSERNVQGARKRTLTGVWGGPGDCIDPAYNPGGIWAPVHLVTSGPVHISSMRVTCPEASAKRAVLDLFAVLDSAERLTVTLRTELRRADGGPEASGVDKQPVDKQRVEKQQSLAVGTNRVRWRLEVASPELWWPVGLGDQPLYDLTVEVEVDGESSDVRALRTGLRQVRMRDLVWAVNGERVFLKGANLAPTRRDLAYASAQEIGRDVALAVDAGLNMVRARAHVGRRELYDATDQAGMLVWQDLPLQGSYKGARRQAVRQAAAAVDLLSHHPSVIVWCGHSEPFSSAAAVGGRSSSPRVLRWAAQQVLPSSNKSVLDRSVRRALARADPSRPVLAHSGVLPHPAWGTSSHLYFGWRYGQDRDLSRAASGWPAAARFVSEMGAQSVPWSGEFMEPERWPDLDWERLVVHHCMQKDIFDQRVPPSRYRDFAAWRDATQAYQARLLRCQVEALRRLGGRLTGGFAVSSLNDAQPAVSASLLDHERTPKVAFTALKAACAPVLVVADWPAPSYRPGARVAFDVHVVNDLRDALPDAVLQARLTWPGGGRQWALSGELGARSCTFVARLAAALPSADALGQGAGLVAARSPDGPAQAEEGASGASWPGAVGTSWPLALRIELCWGPRPERVASSYDSLISLA